MRRQVFWLVSVAIGVISATNAGVAAAGQQKKIQATDIAAVCGQRAQWNDDLLRLKGDRDRQRQILANYGFENTIADFENYEKYATTTAERRERAKKELEKQAVEGAKTKVEQFIEVLREARSYSEVSPKLDKLNRIVKDLGLPDRLRYEIREIGFNDAAQARLTYYANILQWAGRVDAAFDAAQSDNELEILKQGVMTAAGEISPAYGFLAKEIDWAATNLYDAVRGQWTNFQINKLLNATEGDLQLLKKTTADLNATTRQIAALENNLKTAPPCDSTQLVVKNDGSKPAPTGMSTAKKAAILLGVTGGAAATVFAICQPNAESGCPGPGGGTTNSCTTPAPVMPNSNCVGINRNSAVCNAWLSAYDNWCSTCAHKTFNVNTGSCS